MQFSLTKIGNALQRLTILQQIICALFIVLFIYTGLNKLLDHNEFRQQIERSPFIGQFAGFLSYALPLGEIFVALSLVAARTRQAGLYASLLLMTLFTGYVWLMLHYAKDLPCTCGGVLASMSWPAHLTFNAVFTLLALAGVLLAGQHKAAMDNRSSHVHN